MRKLVVLGAGGHGRVVADAAECRGDWSQIVFLDDDWPAKSRNVVWPVVGKLGDFAAFKNPETDFIVAMGNGKLRLGWLDSLQQQGCNIATVIHPSAIVSKYASVEPGVVVFANAVVNIGSRLGFGCIVNTGAGVDHDVELKAGVHICPGVHVAGGVQISECTWVGIGSSVRQMIKIGANVVIGAGAAVVADVPDNVQIVGVPAKQKA